MKVTRDGTKLTLVLNSSSQWTFAFQRITESECHADLVASVINNYYERREQARQAELDRKNDRIAFLERSNAALRGHINRLKTETYNP